MVLPVVGGLQIQCIPIPSPPNLSSSSDDDSDDISDEEEHFSALCGHNHDDDLTSRLLLAEDDLSKDLSNLTLVGPETQARLEALLEAAGVAADGKAFTDPEVLRKLTSSVSNALDEAAAALTRMRSQSVSSGICQVDEPETRSLVEACIEGDIAAVRKLLDEGRSVHEPTDEGESLLSLACSAGYYELVQVLLAMNANVEDRGSKGDCTPLMEASSGGFVDIVQLLLQHGANVNARSSSGNTAMHYACCSGYDTVVKALIQRNAELEYQNENGHTPLMEAASGGHVKVAKLLLDNGAGINKHSSEFKESALTLACYKGHVDMVFFLLERGADQEHKTDEMHTALMEASMDGHVEVAKLLLDHGAQVNMPADSFESPLTLAACGSHVELAQLLIEHGANLEEVNDEGYTPLMEAAREGFLPMVALLLEHGANINSQTEETQETALTLACCGAFQEVVLYLLECGADIELGASTPLMEAATEGHLELVKLLLEKGANVNATTATGDSALTYAAENGHTDLVEIFIKTNADIEHQSEGGRTPLMKAARAGHLCTVEYLISQGVDLNKKTLGDEHTALSLACVGGHAAIVELLLSRGGSASTKLKDNSSMLIEAAKGGHANVACLLIDSQQPNSSNLYEDVHPSYPTPLTSSTTVNKPSFHMCQKIVEDDDEEELHHDCQLYCSHPHHTMLQNQILPQISQPVMELNQHTDLNSQESCGNKICFDQNFEFSPTLLQPSPLRSQNYNTETPIFDNEPLFDSVDMCTSNSEICLPNIPISLASQLSLANLSPSDLHSLAQALSFSSSITSMQEEQAKSAPCNVTESLGLNHNVTFPAVDPQVQSFTTQSEVCTPSPSDTTTALVTSAGRTITSTGVQTEDAISMIQKLTNSVHQLNALQSFAAAHNLELVNLGEITLPPTPFSLDSDVENGVMVANPAVTLEDTMTFLPTKESLGECSASSTIDHIVPIPPPSASPTPMINIDQATDSNHDTALTIACAGGHDDLVKLLLARGANIEHKDKKGCTPLILSATAGHTSSCHLLLDYGADIEAQSDRTKDTALSLACSSGRHEVVELLLLSNANYEHRNVSDYTPLSLAASGGYVGIIKVLLNHGAEINSRTGSKLGISPLMLAAMNGHVAAVKLLLDKGSDVNAQIETNRNTALTLACFQGRTEVVSLLLDQGANVEHRAKTGLTPLMEAASGGYVEVGRVLIDRGADVNAQPVPSSRDTALTIAADKGHFKFVELLVIMGASIDVRNKKGCTPLWLAANGGHHDVCQFLGREGADVNSNDNRGVSCLMASFRKGHIKVTKWLVKHVSQFPPDSVCKRFIQTSSDKDLSKKLSDCLQIVNDAKKRQEAEANKNASILLEELDYEKKKEEKRKAAAQKKRDRKKQKKKNKTTEIVTDEQNEVEQQKNNSYINIGLDRVNYHYGDEKETHVLHDERPDLSLAEIKLKSQKQLKKKEKRCRLKRTSGLERIESTVSETKLLNNLDGLATIVDTTAAQVISSISSLQVTNSGSAATFTKAVVSSIINAQASSSSKEPITTRIMNTMVTAIAQCAVISITTSPSSYTSPSVINQVKYEDSSPIISPKKIRREDGWKEVTRNVQHSKAKKILIPAALISRVIGRGGCNVNAIREYTNALIDIDTNRKKANGDCLVTMKGSQQSIRQASALVQSLIDDPERDVAEILPNNVKIPPSVIRTEHTLHSNDAVSATDSIVFSKSTNMPKMTKASTSYHPPVITCQQGPLSSSLSSNSQSCKTSDDVNHASFTSVTSKSLFTKLSKTSPEWTMANNSGITVANSNTLLLNNGSSTAGMKEPTVRKLFVSASSKVPTTKHLPKPIGSNRPLRLSEITSGVSSTSVSRSITTSLHTTLTSLLSQVETQRSPMIWNDPSPLNKDAQPEEVTTTLTTSPTNSVISPIESYPVCTLSQNSSQDSFRALSRTPSLSPTSNQSCSPTPDDRPHLNPIGSERGSLRPHPLHQSAFVATPPLKSDARANNHWDFDYHHKQASSWTQNGNFNWHESEAIHLNEMDLKSNENTESFFPGESLMSLLERLSLSSYLELFQTNEIDLDALMLMSEEDYAEIGLPKEPRVKLLNSLQELHSNNGCISSVELTYSPKSCVPPDHPNWENEQYISPRVHSDIKAEAATIPPDFQEAIHHQQLHNMVKNSWQQWNDSVDQ